MMEIEQQAAMNGYEAAGSVAVFRRFEKNVLSLNECDSANRWVRTYFGASGRNFFIISTGLGVSIMCFSLVGSIRGTDPCGDLA